MSFEKGAFEEGCKRRKDSRKKERIETQEGRKTVEKVSEGGREYGRERRIKTDRTEGSHKDRRKLKKRGEMMARQADGPCVQRCYVISA